MKVGIIGLGDGGRCNLKSMMMAGAEVVAICDTNEEALSTLRNEIDSTTRVFLDFKQLLDRKEIEFVVVATPDDQHLGFVRAVLEAGKYVFVEKPVATTLDDLKKFQELNKKHPRRILFSEKYSFAHPVQAALACRAGLGKFLCGTTLYTMWKCDRIMGDGKWRTECAYNPCAGGLSHNFMTSLLFTGSPISRVRATGQVLTYHENLDRFGGYDTMEGTLEFSGGQRLSWFVCLAVRGDNSPFGHRTIAHVFQFEHGSLAYGPTPQSDQLIVNGQRVTVAAEPDAKKWGDYNLCVLYNEMHRDLFATITTGKPPLHDIFQGINVAYACCLAFESAKRGGEWIELPS